MEDMNLLKQLFVENFNMEMVAKDLIDMISEKKLFKYMKDEFNNNFTYGELYGLFKQYMNDYQLENILKELGHDFIDLEDLTEEERENFY